MDAEARDNLEKIIQYLLENDDVEFERHDGTMTTTHAYAGELRSILTEAD